MNTTTTYPAIRVILATAAALDDIAKATARLNERLSTEELRQAAGPLYTPGSSCAALLEESRLHLAYQERLVRYAALVNEITDDLREVEVPPALIALLEPYLTDTLSPRLIDLIARQRPEAREALAPRLDTCPPCDPGLPGLGISA